MEDCPQSSENINELSCQSQVNIVRSNNHNKINSTSITTIIQDLTNSTELSTFINSLKITDDKQKVDLVMKIIKKKPWIVCDLRPSEDLLFFIGNLGIEVYEQEENLANTIMKEISLLPKGVGNRNLKIIKKQQNELSDRLINKSHDGIINPKVEGEIPQSKCKLRITTR